jgi:di/tricarboxylate transporter
MVGALVRTGVINNLAHAASHATHGNEWLTTMLILVVSFLFSGFVNNVPYAATMTPIVAEFVESIHGHASSGVLWWSLLLGTVLGGNLTAVGASANIVVVGIAERSGNPVSFWGFTRRGAVVTAVSFVIFVSPPATRKVEQDTAPILDAGPPGGRIVMVCEQRISTKISRSLTSTQMPLRRSACLPSTG